MIVTIRVDDYWIDPDLVRTVEPAGFHGAVVTYRDGSSTKMTRLWEPSIGEVCFAKRGFEIFFVILHEYDQRYLTQPVQYRPIVSGLDDWEEDMIDASRFDYFFKGGMVPYVQVVGEALFPGIEVKS